MDNLNVIDRFMQVFIRYIDSGFGLLSGDVAALTSILVVIDVTLAALFWLLDGEANVLAQLVRKTLYVGSFAFILNNFAGLADAIFASFSTLGLRVTNNGLNAQDLLRPGRLAGVGFQAAWPLLQQAGAQVGLTNILTNFAIMLVLLFAWVVVVLSFFILAVQLFVTVIEFKLSTLAGFVLVPFALWTKTAFLAERALGHVVASGVKVMVLAVIVGIGASFFGDFTNALQGSVTLSQAMSLVLASIALFGLGIFGPGIAAGLVSGGPQLGAGAAVGTASALASGALLVGGTAWSAARLAGVGGLTAVRAATALGSRSSSPSGPSGPSTPTGGAGPSVRSAPPTGEGPSAAAGSEPGWARQLRAARRRRQARTMAQVLREGDKSGSGLSLDLGE
ncbi:type IV secretion system protein TrbL [Enhydrobacter aerosaccus]|uniref:Type IV secretion system protein TrbL n=1 Tax=Enhydrobacter aerosaccus TaxID=225324 RepID=A0A1T4JLH9_9HYPH|nr:P-type conjugative transfer protein TrbL [Enhydrobacter aerosaccus]SJZ31060.1 type IV secretion system protein TrbL [Enhydrobacter aerosaccus]